MTLIGKNNLKPTSILHKAWFGIIEKLIVTWKQYKLQHLRGSPDTSRFHKILWANTQSHKIGQGSWSSSPTD